MIIYSLDVLLFLFGTSLLFHVQFFFFFFSCPVLTVASWPAYRFLKRQVRWSGIPISFRIFHSLLWSTQPCHFYVALFTMQSISTCIIPTETQNNPRRQQRRERFIIEETEDQFQVKRSEVYLTPKFMLYPLHDTAGALKHRQKIWPRWGEK